MSYAAKLTLRLASAAAALPQEVRRRHVGWLASLQQPDGGMPGRRGASDLYYTSFALRALAMLDALNEPIARRAAGFLASQRDRQLCSVDFLSLVTAAMLVQLASGIDVLSPGDWAGTVVEFFEPFRCPQGGYAKTQRGAMASTYHTFLVAMCKQALGGPPEDATEIESLLRRRQRDDGGFVEIDAARHSGTNPTAAALGLLGIIGVADESLIGPAVGFLARMQTSEGGLRANAAIPVADLLSTFTGLTAVAMGTVPTFATERATMGLSPSPKLIDCPAAGQFASLLELPAGGFRAGFWDQAADAEYTFYGLGVLGLAGLT